jgi:thermostable 8-oxoguanine DNA glycosylase
VAEQELSSETLGANVSYAEERSALADVARDVYRRHKKDLQRMKDEAETLTESPDSLWNAIVGAYSTWGSSRGWAKLVEDPENRAKLAYQPLAQLSAAKRYRQIREVLRGVGVRWPNKKSDYLAACFQQIEDMGGPEQAARLLFRQDGTRAKIRFLMSLHGIGPKYARDIMMNTYHEDFRDTIAVDARIKQVSQCLGLSFSGYAEEEGFYQEVAEEAGIEGWDLDRLVYNYTQDFLEALGCSGRQRAAKRCGAGRGEPST